MRWVAGVRGRQAARQSISLTTSARMTCTMGRRPLTTYYDMTHVKCNISGVARSRLTVALTRNYSCTQKSMEAASTHPVHASYTTRRRINHVSPIIPPDHPRWRHGDHT